MIAASDPNLSSAAADLRLLAALHLAEAIPILMDLIHAYHRESEALPDDPAAARPREAARANCRKAISLLFRIAQGGPARTPAPQTGRPTAPAAPDSGPANVRAEPPIGLPTAARSSPPSPAPTPALPPALATTDVRASHTRPGGPAARSAQPTTLGPPANVRDIPQPSARITQASRAGAPNPPAPRPRPARPQDPRPPPVTILDRLARPRGRATAGNQGERI